MLFRELNDVIPKRASAEEPAFAGRTGALQNDRLKA